MTEEMGFLIRIKGQQNDKFGRNGRCLGKRMPSYEEMLWTLRKREKQLSILMFPLLCTLAFMGPSPTKKLLMLHFTTVLGQK